MTIFGREIQFPPYRFGRRHRKCGRRRGGGGCRHHALQCDVHTLADVPEGHWAEIRGFIPGVPADRQARLQAYGLLPGYPILVLQHSPVTVIQVEQLELALESELACEICVEETQTQVYHQQVPANTANR